jgi:[ribosomal protein S5]-alanine N-acetyltransferase
MPALSLASDRLILALPQPEQAAQGLDFFARNRTHLLPWQPPEPEGLFTVEYWDRQIAAIHEGFDSGTSVRLWMWEKTNMDRMIGTIGFSQIFRGPFCSCTLGYQLDQQAEGRGMMFEALQVAIRYMFEQQQLHRIAANYRPENVRSGKLLARLGFRIEGFAKEYLFIDGAWRDHVLTSLTNDRFKPAWLGNAKP